MITDKLYSKLEKQFGSRSSWAVWKTPIEAIQGKSNRADGVDDLSVFNPPPLDVLHTDFVLLGVNPSGALDASRTWGNFHYRKSGCSDYKLRSAIYGTVLWGCYITDFCKIEKKSSEVKKLLRDEEELKKHAKKLKKELHLLGNPIIVCIGDQVYKWMKRSKLNREYKVHKITHYSARGYTTEDYAKIVKDAIQEILKNTKIKISKNYALEEL